MSISSLVSTARNLTTIENLNKGHVVYSLAVFTGTGPMQQPKGEKTVFARNFTILQTDPGDNPWDLGVVRNMKSILGNRYLDWVLPIKYSPCTKHDRADGHFEFGPVLEKVKQRAGLNPDQSRRRSHRRRSSHRSHRSHQSHKSHRSRAENPNSNIADERPRAPGPE
ncbi:uncharacterized protein BDZ99DRAFT_76678 [Mytilinidion resinicola]|uniref:Uncharacterized protein n=1 Tax=Mytilinidion resinicola TaxID=574789 RepID=A0A6A6YGT0_9PEZI|nr:uncharacterized protein BDZ99DRAFT_76678 [Mytilinidion resinicola]KAF2807235.1 hypothetical protein BDZ99DRAFT_76678 [Mytilinidion resinicola]